MAKATEKEMTCAAALRKEFPPDAADSADAGFLNDATYLRFARARNGKLSKATVMLREALAWRAETKPYAITEAEVHDVAGHVQIVCGGRCKEGCPILVLSAVEPEGMTMEVRKKFLTFMLEETARKGYDRITWTLTWGHMAKEKEKKVDTEPNAKRHREEAMKLMQDYYPERMNKILFFHAPFMIRVMMPFMKMALPSVTSEKVQSMGTTVSNFDKHVDREELPRVCGGNKADVTLRSFAELPPIIGK